MGLRATPSPRWALLTAALCLPAACSTPALGSEPHGLLEVTVASFSSVYNCGGYSDSGLQNFRDQWLSVRMWVGPNAYSIFHAYDGQKSVAGCGGMNCTTAPSGCLSNSNTGTNEVRASHSIQGKDWSSTDSYNPNDSEHLGLAVGHELSHNAGEPDHPSDLEWCSALEMSNVMASEAFWCVDMYWVWQSEDRVEDYAWSRIHR